MTFTISPVLFTETEADKTPAEHEVITRIT